MRQYSIKIALRGISPMIWRRLRLSEKTSLAELHYAIQCAMGWDDDHLHCFHIYGKDYGISYAGGCCFSEDPNKVILADFDFDICDRFTYTFNFTERWESDIRIESIDEIDDSILAVPYCTGGQGRRGDQLYYKGDEACALLDVLSKIFIDKDPSTTVGDIRQLIERYDSIRFNRSAVNNTFSEQLADQVE